MSYMDMLHVFIGMCIGILAGIPVGFLLANWGDLWKI